MSNRKKRVAMTNGELQKALTILLRASSSDGLTPLPSVASSATSILATETGSTSARASYVLTCLAGGGVIERIDGTHRYQLQRGTLERDELDKLTLPQRIENVKRTHGTPVPAVGDDNAERLSGEVQGLLEENEGLTDENEGLTKERDRLTEENDRLSSKVVELDISIATANSALAFSRKVEKTQHDELVLKEAANKALVEKVAEYEKAMKKATSRIDELEGMNSENKKMHFQVKKMTKEREGLKLEISGLKSSTAKAENAAASSKGEANRLRLRLEAHGTCVSGTALAEAREAILMVQSVLGTEPESATSAEPDMSLSVVS